MDMNINICMTPNSFNVKKSESLDSLLEADWKKWVLRYIQKEFRVWDEQIEGERVFKMERTETKIRIIVNIIVIVIIIIIKYIYVAQNRAMQLMRWVNSFMLWTRMSSVCF